MWDEHAMDKKPAHRERPVVIWHSWRPHLTMVVSIANRITGVGLYLGALIAAAWAIALASGPHTYARFQTMLGSWPGKVVMIGMTFSYFFHFGGGIRHLVFDAGYGFHPKAATQSAAAVLIFAIAATAIVWGIAFAVHT